MKREIDTDIFLKEIANHNCWLESNGSAGAKADFSNTIIHVDMHELDNYDSARTLLVKQVSFVGAEFKSHSDREDPFKLHDLHQFHSNAVIRNLDFIECDFTDANLNRIDIGRCTFYQSILDNASIQRAYIHDSEIIGVKSSFNKTHFNFTTFQAVIMDNMTMMDTYFNDATFKQTQLKDIHFSGALLNSLTATNDVAFQNCKFTNHTYMLESNLKHAEFSDCTFVERFTAAKVNFNHALFVNCSIAPDSELFHNNFETTRFSLTEKPFPLIQENITFPRFIFNHKDEREPSNHNLAFAVYPQTNRVSCEFLFKQKVLSFSEAKTNISTVNPIATKNPRLKKAILKQLDILSQNTKQWNKDGASKT